MKWVDSSQCCQTLDVPYYTFENLERSGLVVNAFTTRLYRKDGKKMDFFQPLLRADSDPEEVRTCVQMLLRQFGIDEAHLVPSSQKHTTNIRMVTADDLKGRKEPVLEGIDGLITNLPGVMLQIFGADCPSVYLLDPVQKAIGLCHSGRKGTQKHIARVMLEKMTRAYGTKPQDVLAAISPGICRSCYEVGDDVAEEFACDYTGLSHTFPEAIFSQKNGRYYIDLFAAIRLSLEAAGVPASHIEASHLCTKCRSDIFYSFRAEGRISNQNSALFMLK